MPFDPIYGNLGDQELLTLGRAAGYLPEDQALENPADSAPTRADFRDWVPEQMGSIPVQNGSYTDMEAPPAPGPTKTSQSVGVNVGNKGFSGNKYGQVSRTEGDLNRDLAGADATAKAGAERDEKALRGSQTSLIDAEKAKAEAEVKKIAAGGKQALVFQRLQDDFAVEEMKANAEAQSMATQAKNDYLTALADFRASKVDPSQLWVNMTGGERFGTLASAFVHDFLGARGINTSAMATFNKAVDRNIDAQIQAIKTKGEVAEGFKSLWYMQRNQSASDAEARARVRGFLLEGTKQQVIANMAQYESGLASAQGQAAIAKINDELAKNLVDIYRHADQNAIALRNQALDKWKTKLQASLEQTSLGLRRQELDMRQKELDAKNNPQAQKRVLYDPETGQAMWYLKNGITEKEEVDARTLLEDVDNLNEEFTELRALGRQAESTADPLARTRLASTIHQKMDALSTRIAHGMAKANSERATDQDVLDFLKGMRAKTWLNRGDVDQVLAFTHQNLIKPAYSKVKSVAHDLPEEERAQYGTSATIKPFKGALTDASNTASPPPLSPEEKSRINAGTLLRSADKNDVLEGDDLTADVKTAKEDFFIQNPQYERKGVTAVGKIIGKDPLGNQLGTTLNVTRGDKGLVRLRDAVMLGLEPNASEEVKDSAAKAYSQLLQVAGPTIHSGTGDADSAFAAFLIHGIPGSNVGNGPLTEPIE